MNTKLQNTLSIVTSSSKIEVKVDSLLSLVHDGSEEMKRCLNNDDLLYDFIKRRCSDNTDRLHRICLECTKYWGTVAQIPKYRELIDILFDEGVDLPNTYTYNMTSQNQEQEQLRLFLQLISDHQLDTSALIDIIKKDQVKEKQKQMLNIYKEAFTHRLIQIDSLMCSEGILTNEQLQQLQQIKIFEMHFNKQFNKLKIDKFIKWISQELNIQIEIPLPQQPQSQIIKQESILVIENPQESDRNNQISPFIQAERNLRIEFNHHIQKIQSIELADKHYSGKIVQEHLQLQEFDERQLLKMKKACIRSRQALFDSHEIQLGVIRKQITKEELFTNFLELTFVVGNKTRQSLHDCELLFEEPRGLQFWLPSEPVKTEVIKQEKMACLIAYQHVLFQPLKGQFQWVDSGQVYEAKFVVPCLLSQFMTYSPIGRKYFKFIWSKKKDFCWRSKEFKLNTQVIKSMLDFKRYNPMLCYLVDLQDFLDLKKDLKLGGEFTLQDTRVKQYIKIIVRQNSQVIVKVTGLYEAVQLIKCLEFILKE